MFFFLLFVNLLCVKTQNLKQEFPDDSKILDNVWDSTTPLDLSNNVFTSPSKGFSTSTTSKYKTGLYCPPTERRLTWDETYIGTTVLPHLTWDETYIGTTVLPHEFCLNLDYSPVTRTCESDLENGAVWSYVKGNCSDEVILSDTTKKLRQLFYSIRDNDGKVDLGKKLSDLAQNFPKNITVIDLYFAVHILKELSYNFKVNVVAIVDSVNHIMLSNRTVLRQGQDSLNLTDHILYGLDKILISQKNISSLKNSKILIESTNLLSSEIIGWSLFNIGDNFETKPILIDTSVEEIISVSPEIAVFIPDLVLKQLETLRVPDMRLIVTFFLNDALFNEENSSNATTNFTVSILITEFKKKIAAPIQIFYKSHEHNGKYCAFWKYGLDDEKIVTKGKWVDTIEFNFYKSYQVCYISHLSHFSLLETSTTRKIIHLYCPVEVTNISGTILTWKETRIGSTVVPLELCLNLDYSPVTRSCKINSENGAVWSKIKGKCSGEVNISDTTKKLQELLNSTTSDKVDLSKNLSNLTQNFPKNVTVIDLYFAVQILEKLSNSFKVNLVNIVDSVNNIMMANKSVLRQGQNKLNLTDNILYYLDNILVAQKNDISSLKRSKIIIETTKLSSNVTGWSLHNVGEGNFETHPISKGTSLQDIKNSSFEVATFVPDEVLTHWENFQDVTLIVTCFLNDALFNDKNTSNGSTNFTVSILIPGFENDNFPAPIPILYKSYANQDRTCVFWKYGLNDEELSIKGKWVSSNESDETLDTVLICNFSHLTHFAMLVTDHKYSSLIDNILSSITIVGCSLSFFGIVVIFITALAFKSWRNEHGNIILIHFLTSVLLTYASLLAANATPSGDTCKFFGILLHYSILSQFIWMFLMSYLQYRRFVIIFYTDISIARLSLIGWLTPIVPVAIVVTINSDEYHKNASNLCYLSNIYLKLGVLLPISFILILNITFFVSILVTVTRKKPESTTKTESKIVFRLIFFLFFLMGITWIFGIILAFDGDVIFSFFFCLTCTLQGFIVSLTYVVSTKTKLYWINFTKKRKVKSKVRQSSVRGLSYKPLDMVEQNTIKRSVAC